jgi:hypothetical protein
VVGVADPRNEVPVIARRPFENQWGPWRNHVQPPLRIERIGKPQQVPLVGPASVVEHEQTLGLTGARALQISQRLDPPIP